MWKDRVYASHSRWVGDWHSGIWQCISLLDMDAQLMAAEYCFDQLPIYGGNNRYGAQTFTVMRAPLVKTSGSDSLPCS